MAKISIRNAKFAKIGLQDMIMHVQRNSDKHFSKFVMAEIGSYVGDSTGIFAQSALQVHCVDPWENGYDENDPSSYKFDMSIIEAQFDALADEYYNIVKHKAYSVDGAKNFDDQYFDMVYIDGLHTYDGVIDDINAWFDKVKDDGWICGHDYGHKLVPGVKQAIDELLGEPKARFRDTSFAIKKKDTKKWISENS